MIKIKKFLFGTYARGFVTSYLLFMFLGASCLKLPFSIANGQKLSWIDAIFVSVSGMSTTGLSTVNVSEVLTPIGQTILAMILQFGGIGLIMFIGIFWLFIGKEITFKERNMIMTDQNQVKRSGVVRLIKSTLIIIFSIEIVSIIIMGLYLYFKGYFGLGDSFFQAFFLTISMFTNAGFDITGTSLFNYSNDYFMQLLAMFLMFTGAVGFWPLVEFFEFIKSKFSKEQDQPFKFSMFAKIVFTMHLSIWLFSAVFVYIIEFNNFLSDKSLFEGIFYSLFMSLTTRNAGFATMDVTNFSATTQVLFSILMFIGSSPNSAGGGLRTTTILLTILGIAAYASGRDQVVINKRSIKSDTVRKCFVAFIAAVMLIFFDLLILTITESSKFSPHEILFEICSAFGTTGLSLGLTAELSFIGKIVLIVTMFIGRVGVLTLLVIFKSKDSIKRNTIKYPEVDIIVG